MKFEARRNEERLLVADWVIWQLVSRRVARVGMAAGWAASIITVVNHALHRYVR